MDKKICVLGLGYIGLPTASILAVNGFWVIGVDINPRIVETINKGEIHIHEPGLDIMVKSATLSGHLEARPSPEYSDVFIISVPTPITHEKCADLNAVVAATESILPYLREGNLVILESTVPPGTTDSLVVPILERSGLKACKDFQVVHAPERVLPGKIMDELIHNDRILGGIDPDSAERARNLYQSFVSGNIYLTDATTAELVKLVENAFRDINIAFANELAKISKNLGVNVWDVIDLANKHPRVNVLQPGPGVGGHCIAVDPWFLAECFPEDSQLIKLGRIVNDNMPTYVSESIKKLVEGFDNPKVVVMGMAYKANVDDIRESPSLIVVDQLKQAGCNVMVHDPYVYPDIKLEEVIKEADCLALLVDHLYYRNLDPELLGKLMRRKIIFVARNYPGLDNWFDGGFKVEQLGNGKR